jgi:hypothetical protein
MDSFRDCDCGRKPPARRPTAMSRATSPGFAVNLRLAQSRRAGGAPKPPGGSAPACSVTGHPRRAELDGNAANRSPRWVAAWKETEEIQPPSSWYPAEPVVRLDGPSNKIPPVFRCHGEGRSTLLYSPQSGPMLSADQWPAARRLPPGPSNSAIIASRRNRRLSL